MFKAVPIEKRFWDKVEIRGADDCWPWKAKLNESGYGIICTSKPGQRQLRAHRVAYELTHGVELGESVIRHSCDNPPCCNPSHLIMGTHSDNVQDCISRGRRRWWSKLTEEQAIGVMARLLTGRETQTAIAKDLGVSVGCINNVWSGHTWSHLFKEDNA